jgi:hypothetical protein
MKMEKSRSSLLLALALMLSSCSSSTAEVTFQLRPGAPSSNIAKVEVTVASAGEEANTTTLSGKTSPWTGSSPHIVLTDAPRNAAGLVATHGTSPATPRGFLMPLLHLSRLLLSECS